MPLRYLALCALGLLVGCAGDNSAPTPVPTPVVVQTGLRNYAELIVSPDGRNIAFTVFEDLLRTLYIAEIDGRNARRVRRDTSLVMQRDVVFSPDGSAVAFVEADGPGTGDVYIVAVSGGEPVRLTNLRSQVENLSFSPGGSRILFRSEHADTRGSYWMVPTTGGEITPLKTDSIEIVFARWLPDSTKIGLNIRGDSPASSVVAVLDVPTGRAERITAEGFETLYGWSPDGTELVYASERTGQGDLWVAPTTGGPARQLTIDVRDEDHGVYSPDGRWIAYHSERGGQWDIWIVPAAGGDAFRVTNDPAVESPPEWTPDSGALLFSSEDISTRLYAVPVSGGAPRMLSAADQRDEELHVSPDGKTVVHVQQHAGLGELWLTPISGGESRPLVRGSENSDPRWSPDGSMIAFDSRRGTHFSVWVVNVATGEERQVSPPGLSTGLVDWSRDGTRLLIHTRAEGTPPRILSVSLTGEDATTIADLDGFPVPSPDGEMLAFARAFGDGDRGIYVVPTAGGSATLLTPGQRMEPAAPAWSSDSRRIAYNVFSEDGGTIDVFMMNADGSGRRRLTYSPALELGPQWSADNAEIFYRDGADRLSAVNVATGEIRTIFEGDPAIVGVVVVSSDGETLVFSGSTARSEIMRVDVRDLLGNGR